MLKTMKSGLIDKGGTGRWAGDDLKAVAAFREGELWRDVVAKKQSTFFWAIGLSVIACGAVAVLWSEVEDHNAAIALGAVGILVVVGMIVWAFRLEPEQRVGSVSRVYWPILALPLDDKVAVYDLSGVYPKREISLRLLNQPDRLPILQEQLQELMGELRILEPDTRKVTVSEVPLFGVDADLVATLDSLKKVLADTTTLSSLIPAIPADDPVIEAIAKLRPHIEVGNASPVAPVPQDRPVVEVNDGILGVYQESASESHYDIDDILAELETYSEVLMNNLETAHHESMALMQASHRLATWTVSWPTMNMHCPLCTSKDNVGDDGGLPNSTRLFLDPTTRHLRCPVCSAQMADRHAIKISRFSQEVFKPAYFQVLLSLRNEILRIDREIDRQLMELSDKRVVELKKLQTVFKQERRNKIERLRGHKSRSDALKAQVLGMTAAMVKYERIASGINQNFRSDCDAIAREVEARAQAAEARIRQQFQVRAQQAENEAAVAYAIKKAEEDRKHRELTAATLMTEREKADLKAPKSFGDHVVEAVGWPSANQRRRDEVVDSNLNAADRLRNR